MPHERLQKIIARAGITSRRKAEELIRAGKVRVNGAIVRELGTRADAHQDRIEVNGRRIVRPPPVYVLMNKPRATVTTRKDPRERRTVIELLKGVSQRVFPVGRLDYHTTGALLLTNDGEMAQALAHPGAATPRVYLVKVQGRFDEAQLEDLLRGVPLDDGVARATQAAVTARREGSTTIQLTLREGRYHEVRRMMQALGHRVSRLSRVSFAGLTTEGLAPGQWRHLTDRELSRLKRDYLNPFQRRRRASQEPRR